MAIKSVFFDLDGTLWDHRACSAYVFTQALKRRERMLEGLESNLPNNVNDVLNAAFLDNAIEYGLRGVTQSSYTLRLSKFFELCQTAEGEYIRELSSLCHQVRRFSIRSFLKDDAHETLIKLNNRGIRTGILTNGTPAVQRNIIEMLGLDAIVDYTVLGEAEGYVKPDRRLFKLCVELADAEPKETLFAGDSFFTDLLGAKRCGAKAVLISDKKVRIPARIPPPDFALKYLKSILKIV